MATAQATVKHATVTLTDKPTLEQLQTWWQEMWGNPEELQGCFSDLMPRLLATFLESDMILLLISEGSDCVASVWLHDLHRVNRRVQSGWIGGWIAPSWRGPIGVAALQLALQYFHDRGVEHIFSAINVTNRASVAMTMSKSMMGFTRVMRFPAFLPFQGIYADCIISTFHPEDVEYAKTVATERARSLAHLGAA